jgi:hypothetical protein
MWVGGGLVKREKDTQNDLSLKSQLGLSPTRFFFQNLPPGLQFNDPEFKDLSSFKATVEYGITESIGIGFSLSTLSMNVIHNQEYPDPKSFNFQAPTFQFTKYTEVLPTKTQFYKDEQYSFFLSYHFMNLKRIDPFVFGEVGFVNFQAYAKKENRQILLPTFMERGFGAGLRGGFGFNLFLASEFAIQMEFSAQQKWLRSDIIGNSTLSSFGIQMGVVYNFEMIVNVR